MIENESEELVTALDTANTMNALKAHTEEFHYFESTLQKRDEIRANRESISRIGCKKTDITCPSFHKGSCNVRNTDQSPLLNIVLHSQTLCRDDGYTSGSEVTTFGMEQALLRRPDVHSVLRVGPGRYTELWEAARVDVMIIEGYHLGIEKEVMGVQARHPGVVIVFVNLSLSGFEWSVRLPVDIFATNSRTMGTILREVLCREYC